MALDSYNSFLSDVAGWLERSNLTARIPDFIKLAELRLNRDLRVSWLSKVQTYNIVVDGVVDYALPDRFNGVRSIKVVNNPTISLRYKTPEEIDESNSLNGSGNSIWFTIIANQLRIVPSPGIGNSVELNFYQNPIPLSASVQTNEYVTNCPDALLYGSLLEAAPYIKDAEKLKTWSDLYTNSIAAIMNTDKVVRWGESSLEPSAAYGNDYSDSCQTG